MSRQTSAALKRADRVVALALVLALASSAASVALENAPTAHAVAFNAKQAVARVTQRAAQFARNGESAAINAGVVFLRGSEPADRVAISVPVSARAVSEPLKAVVTPSPATEATIIKVLEDQRCLAEAMYYEARGEGRSGQEAIAEVIFHRMHSRGYPHSICGVVYQGSGHRSGCQFSFACDGELHQAKTPGAWWRARMLAAKIMAGVVQLGDVTENAISFHATDVQPDWADHLERTIQIGNHVFYRAASRTKSS